MNHIFTFMGILKKDHEQVLRPASEKKALLSVLLSTIFPNKYSCPDALAQS